MHFIYVVIVHISIQSMGNEEKHISKILLYNISWIEINFSYEARLYKQQLQHIL